MEILQENGNLEYTSGNSGDEVLEKSFCGDQRSAADKFVEEILARDMEIRLPFPEIFDENYEF